MDNTNNIETNSFMLQMGRQAGVCLHISSLPGPHGIGDIGDTAHSCLDQLAEMGIGVWQFLPTGPTAYGDSPYQPLSAFAGNAMLVGMEPLVQLGLLDDNDIEPLKSLPTAFVDYGRLIPMKRALLAKAAERLSNRFANGLTAEYEEFLHQHGQLWLDDYALFRVLKSAHGEKAWPEWEKGFVRREPAALEKARNTYRKQMENTRITQFLFWSQWQQFSTTAKEKGICLFGDMPIYIALDSADAWSHPELLMIDDYGQPLNVAGVPPDYFSEDGQLWGNPLYDWDFHQRSGYQWWIERMQHAANLNQLVRVDHFRGFESFWSIPSGAATARKGEWLPGPGNALFEAMRESLGNLPIVAEDLGIITPEVDALRLNHSIPGMSVLQFEVGEPDFNLDAIDANCACYTGTHDNDTTVGWFLGTGEDTRSEEEVKAHQANALKVTGGTTDTIHLDMINLAFSSQAALAVAPMQDYLGLGSDARMNIPGTTGNNWRWRITEEQLTPKRVESVREMVRKASR